MKKWLGFAALALILISNTVWFYSTLGWDAVDDAYISYVYAHNAILGHGLTFNPGERVEGFSNFLWTAMMLPIVGGGFDVGRLSSVLGVAFGIGVLALAICFPKRLGLPGMVGWMAALLLAVDGSFALWSVSGLETSMMAFLLTLGAFLYVREQSSPPTPLLTLQSTMSGEGSLNKTGIGGIEGIPLSGIVFALAAMTRPEAVAVFGLTVAHQVAWRLVAPRTLAAQRKFLTRGDVFRIGSFLALFLPYWLIRWRYYHSLLPNSFYAKVAVGGPLAQILRGWAHVQQFVGVHWGWMILVPAVIALAVAIVRYVGTRRERTPFRSTAGDAAAGGGNATAGDGNATASVPYNRAGMGTERTPFRSDDERRAFFGFTYFAAVILFYGVYIIYVGGDWSVGRFFVPFLALVYLMIAAGIYWVVEFVVRRFSLGTSRRAQGAMLLAILFAPALWYASAYNGEYSIFIGDFSAGLATHARITAGKWLKQNVPAGTWIAVDAAGQVPYFSELPAIDMFGINDLHIGRMAVANLGSGTPGHEKFDLGYIIARAPKYVVIYGTLFDSVTEYKRSNLKWTDNPDLEKFLTIYERADGK